MLSHTAPCHIHYDNSRSRKDNLCEVQAKRSSHNSVTVADSPELARLADREGKMGITAGGGEESWDLAVWKGEKPSGRRGRGHVLAGEKLGES